MDKNKKTFQVPTLLAFAAIVAIMVIVGVRVLNVPVVPMCLLVIIEAVIAVMLHHAELWVHGLLILAELCAGVASAAFFSAGAPQPVTSNTAANTAAANLPAFFILLFLSFLFCYNKILLPHPTYLL